jgi:hypothetical protein
MNELVGPDSKAPKLIINLKDVYDQRALKKKELDFYTAELDKCIKRLGKIQYEIGVNETIIRLIENEQILDIQEAVREKRDG